ncbi:MAG: TRAP transporter substrate-binding protein DctP [Alphaproteobacteria bacterium]|nr:TRAP transporter substrate-binding protein DctP [Alphaproteobacteria bacterium]
MKHPLVKIMAVILTLTVAAPALAATIKLGSLAPKGSPWHKALEDLAVEWAKLSAGKVRLRIYPGGVAGDEPDMVRKMRIGQLHAAALTGAGLARIAQEVQALQMPMMFRSDAELDHVRSRLMPKLNAALEAKGVHVLNWADAGWVYFFTQKPVVSPDDLKPLKLFAWVGETAHIGAWRAAGYNPVPLPATEIHTGLSSGLINAVPTTPIAALSYQWFGLAKHMTDVKWAPLVGATVITKRGWRRVPAALRDKLRDAAREMGRKLQPRIRKLDSEAITIMKKHGLKVHEVPPPVEDAWVEGARQGYARLIDKVVPGAMVAEVERLRDAYRAAQGK